MNLSFWGKVGNIFVKSRNYDILEKTSLSVVGVGRKHGTYFLGLDSQGMLANVMCPRGNEDP